VYSTSEGDVLLSLSDTGVFVSEGFPLELARKLRDKIESVQTDSPLQVAGAGSQGTRVTSGNAAAAPSFDPGLALVRTMEQAGVMRAAISGRYTLGQR
jgi:hypothetical protein